MDITAKHDSGSLGIVIEHHVETLVRDGTVLRSNVYRPDDDARYPGLLTRTLTAKIRKDSGWRATLPTCAPATPASSRTPGGATSLTVISFPST